MSSTRNRKHESGAEKHRKKQRLEAFAQSQKGALHIFDVSVRETREANFGDGQSLCDDAVEVGTDTPEAPTRAHARESSADHGGISLPVCWTCHCVHPWCVGTHHRALSV
jgi:hypothetical protein